MRGTGGLVWAMIVPVIYALAASPVISLWGQWAVDTRTWGVMFGLMPVALVAGFFVAFWAGNGFKTLMFVRHYQPMAIAGAGGAAAVAAGAMAAQGDGDEGQVAAVGEEAGTLEDTDGLRIAADADGSSILDGFDISA